LQGRQAAPPGAQKGEDSDGCRSDSAIRGCVTAKEYEAVNKQFGIGPQTGEGD
jgi:hypothetical protein